MLNSLSEKNWFWFLTAILITSNVGNGLYYHLFGLNIFSYIEPSEILLMFSDSGWYLLGILLSFLFGIYGRQYFPVHETIFDRFHRFDGSIDKSSERIKLKIFIAINQISLFCIVSSIYLKVLVKESWIVYMVSIGLVFFIYTINIHNWAYKLDKENKGIYFVKLFIYVQCFVAYFSVSQYNSVIYGDKYKNTTIIFSDSFHRSDSKCFYIGQCRNFIFFHDKMLKRSIAIPKTDFKAIIFPNHDVHPFSWVSK